MAHITKDKSLLLDKLISDCVTFGLDLKESLEYIRKEYPDGSIGERTYFRRRKKLLSDKTRNSWFSYFCRIGFVEVHKKLMEDVQRQYDDTIHEIYVQMNKSPRNEDLIIRLKKLYLEIAHELAEFSVGIPVIAGVKEKLDKYQNGDYAQGVDYHYKRSLN